MKKFELQFVLLLVVAVLCIFGMYGELVYGGIVEIPSNPDGDGGPGPGYPTYEYQPQSSFNGNVDLPGYRVDWSGNTWNDESQASIYLSLEDVIFESVGFSLRVDREDPSQWVAYLTAYGVCDPWKNIIDYSQLKDINTYTSASTDRRGISVRNWADVNFKVNGTDTYLQLQQGFSLSPSNITYMDYWYSENSWTSDHLFHWNAQLGIHGYFLDTPFATGAEIGEMFLSSVPEPATISLLCLGAGFLLRMRKR